MLLIFCDLHPPTGVLLWGKPVPMYAEVTPQSSVLPGRARWLQVPVLWDQLQCDGGDGRQAGAGAGAGLVTAPPLLRPHLQRLLLWSEEADTWLDWGQLE